MLFHRTCLPIKPGLTWRFRLSVDDAVQTCTPARIGRGAQLIIDRIRTPNKTHASFNDRASLVFGPTVCHNLPYSRAATVHGATNLQ